MVKVKKSPSRLLRKLALYAALGAVPVSACLHQESPEKAQPAAQPTSGSTRTGAPASPVGGDVADTPEREAAEDPASVETVAVQDEDKAPRGPVPTEAPRSEPTPTPAKSPTFGFIAGKKSKDRGGAYRRRTARPQDVATGDFEGRDDQTINAPKLARDEAQSTFAVDVDTAAYSISRRSLLADRMPTPTLVRLEEFINYFAYDYDAPTADPFSIQIDGAQSPVDAGKHLLRVGVQAKIVEDQDRAPSNLVFLIDTSCSMTSGDKLALTKKSLALAVDRLGPKDQVAITTYAGGVGVVLRPTPVTAANKRRIKKAIRELRTAGGTAMASGLTLAYKQAARMLAPDTNTRIIVCSDGDANIGATSADQILKQVAGYVSEGVRLSTIGFGDGNYKDSMMETLANKGNGNYYYVDSMRQAERIFGRDLTKMLQDVAQDVKIQVEFNDEAVKSWRLVGYENRHIANKDFRNDKVDAGEIGAGHQVTALYELTLQPEARGQLATVRVRSKTPRALRATETERAIEVARVARAFSQAPEDLRFATAVMGGAELMRHSPFAASWSYDRVINLISDAMGRDADRAEFLALMKKARRLSGSTGRRLSYK